MKNKICKLLSIMLAIAVTLSCCVIGLTTLATDEVKATYYLSANSNAQTRDGTTNAPFKTVEEALIYAVKAAETGGYNSPENTVNFKLLDTYANNDGNIVYWGDGLKNVSWKFTLNVSSNTSGAAVGQTNYVEHTYFNGPIVFENVNINVASSSYQYSVYLCGSDVTIASDVDIWGVKYARLYTSTYDYVNKKIPVYTEAQTLNYNYSGTNVWPYFVIGGRVEATYDNDFNLNYNNPNTAQTISLGGTFAANYVATFNKNLNLNFLASKGITLEETVGGVKFGENAAVQIINSTGNTVDYSALEADFATVDTYVFTNNTGIKDLIAFTDKAGEYAVDTLKYNVIATAADGTEFPAKDGKLAVEPGKYNLTVKTNSKEVYYYISANATGISDGTKDAPFKTIGQALTKAVADADAGYYNFANSTVYFKILDTAPVVYSDASGIAFNFKLNISSDISGAALANNATATVNFCGPVTLENIDLQMNKADTFYFNANDFIVGEGAEVVAPDMSADSAQTYFVLGAGATEKTADEEVNVSYVDNGTRNITFFALGGGATTNYDADLNFTFNAPHYQKIRLGTVSSGYAYYNKNVNLNFQSANGIDLVKGNDRFVFAKDAALQIINSTGKAVNFEGALQTALANVPTYVITNNTGIKDIITFTEKAGEYKVDTAKYQITAVKDDGTKYPAKNGLLTVPAGEYELSVKSSDGSVDYLKKMLYFYTSGNTHKLSSQVYVATGKTYCYEFSIYCNNFDDLTLYSDAGAFTNIVKEKIGDYYRVTAENHVSTVSSSALVGIELPAYSEGVIFDRTFYEKGDTAKTDKIVENQKFYSGLDGIKLDSTFWGNIYTGDKGGKGVTYWTNGFQVLKTEYLNTDFIKELISLANPNNSQWSNNASNDINGIEGFDIRDLVYASELVGTDFTEADFNSVAEKNDDNIINGADVSIIRTELLTGVEYQNEQAFTYEGYAETQRNTLLNKILKAPNTLETYSVTGTVYYVSDDGNYNSDGKSSSQPFTLDKLKTITLKSGDAVLFERGSVFRLNDEFNCVGGVTYGSYGSTGDKPMFLGSECDFADGTWTASSKRNVWKINYPSDNDIAGGFFNDGEEIGVLKPSVRALYKNMDFYYDKENAVIYLYSDKGKPSLVWDNIEFSQTDVHFDIATHITNVTIDNLALKYMGTFGVSADFNNHYITVTNCEIGFIGGTMMSNGVRYGNGIQTWSGGHDLKFENNWIYQTFDTAITPQGAAGSDWSDYYNISISGNLFEYNNADIEIWEAGIDMSGVNVSKFYDWKMNNNIHRFTSLGWGTRTEEGSRGIQGVHVGQIRDHKTTNFTWNNNIIDCPGDYIFNKICHYESEYNAFERTGNTYYIKQGLRRHGVISFGFCWIEAAQVDFTATNREQTIESFNKLEPNSTVYWYE